MKFVLLWLLLFTEHGQSTYDCLKMINNERGNARVDLILPVLLDKDEYSGCVCRSTEKYEIIVCFGNYECKKFPQVSLFLN